jgi:hypothetical protein
LNEEKNIKSCPEPSIGATTRSCSISPAVDEERTHRTASLQVGFKHGWVFNPDADEIPSSALIQEMLAVTCEDTPDVAAFRMRRTDKFIGR